MILQALYQYYNRVSASETGHIPEVGYSEEKISFAIVLNREGDCTNTIDLRTTEKGKLRPKLMFVPAGVPRTSGIRANCMWDKTQYVLGVAPEEKNAKRTQREFEEFLKLQTEFAEHVEDDGIDALILFLKKQAMDLHALDLEEDLVGTNLVFRLEDDDCYLHERPILRDSWVAAVETAVSAVRGQCLITGEESSLARVHAAIKGAGGGKSDVHKLVSMNLESANSYGRTQGYIASIGYQAAFGYATALNHLLRFDSRQRISIGEAVTVFWAERRTPEEDLLKYLFDPPKQFPTDEHSSDLLDDVGTALMIREVLQVAREGRPITDAASKIEPGVRFYILGMSPGKARLSVRFWNVCTFGEIVERVGRHFRDMAIERQHDEQPEFLSLFRVVLETAPVRKKKNKTERNVKDTLPLLAGQLARAVVGGERYPQTLYTAIVSRIRADKVVNYVRAAILKAVLVRNRGKEISMSLDTERKDTPYLLGRLFAILEKAQKDAAGKKKLNRTIKDRYFGAASATPRTVFPQLLRLAQHHITKAEYGGYNEKLVGEVMQDIDGFPAHLSLDDQGIFSIGYYHQRNARFQKQDKE